MPVAGFLLPAAPWETPSRHPGSSGHRLRDGSDHILLLSASWLLTTQPVNLLETPQHRDISVSAFWAEGARFVLQNSGVTLLLVTFGRSKSQVGITTKLVPEDSPASAGPGQGHCDALVPYCTCPNPSLSPPLFLSPLMQDSPQAGRGPSMCRSVLQQTQGPHLFAVPLFPFLPQAGPGSGAGTPRPQLALCGPLGLASLPAQQSGGYVVNARGQPWAGGSRGSALTPQQLLIWGPRAGQWGKPASPQDRSSELHFLRPLVTVPERGFPALSQLWVRWSFVASLRVQLDGLGEEAEPWNQAAGVPAQMSGTSANLSL